ncbi:MAG: ABC transporter permease [Actinomycetota bacterium]|nr:ABC transporter permease [Actinomycetota bacterium]
MSFFDLVLHNITVKKLRLALTSLAVAIGVFAVVALGVVTESLKQSDLAILQTGLANFTVAQKGVSDLLSSNVDIASTARIRALPGVASVTGVLLGTARLNAANPQFLEIGIEPSELAPFGVTVLQGRAFGARAAHEILLGWRAAQSLGAHVGDQLTMDENRFRVVGIYSTGQAFGDSGCMVPLAWFQTFQRQPATYTLLFVRTSPNISVSALQGRVDRDFPQLVAIRTLEEFGRADRSLSLVLAANDGASILAVVIGAIVVMSAMSMSFIERIREFGVLSAIGWSRRRVAAMIFGEAALTGVIGVAGGLVLSLLAVTVVAQLPNLTGVLHPVYTAGVFARGLLTAAAMVLIGALVPSVRAASSKPMDALRHE